MKRTAPQISHWLRISLVLCGLILAPGVTPFAHAALPLDEGNVAEMGDTDAPPSTSQGPVRLARFSYMEGNVTWRPDPSVEWSPASINLPLRQGAQIFVPDEARAEVQFDDGSYLRLGSGATVTFQTLYSDADGEFTEIKLTEGLASLRLKNKLSIYQIDTPTVSVKSVGPAKVRVGVRDTVEIAVKGGRATVEGKQGQATLNEGDFLDVASADAPMVVAGIPGDDSWEDWNSQRDAALEAPSQAKEYLPPNIYLVSQGLDSYGSWHDVPEYGHVWYPSVAADWSPYHHGHWVWVNPFGWTWCADEPWGWAPYHYGTWCHTAYGWGWVPGPVAQYWSPACVHFCEVDGGFCWVPLAPREVHYPSVLSIGFHSGNWSLFFSIGQAGCYYPSAGSVCEGRPWNTVYVNHVTNVTNITNVTNVYNGHGAPGESYFAGNHNSFVPGSQFVPANARYGGGSFAPTNSFGNSRGGYQSIAPTNAGIFSRGKYVGAPVGNGAPLAGPVSARPTLASLTPTHTFGGVAPPSNVAARTVYQAPTSQQIARSGLAAVVRNPASGASTFTPSHSGAITGVRTNGSPAISAGSISSRPNNSGVIGRTTMPAPTSAESEVMRARESLGLPARVRRSDGTAIEASPRSSATGNVSGAQTGSSTSHRTEPGTPGSGSVYAGTRRSEAGTTSSGSSNLEVRRTPPTGSSSPTTTYHGSTPYTGGYSRPGGYSAGGGTSPSSRSSYHATEGPRHSSSSGSHGGGSSSHGGSSSGSHSSGSGKKDDGKKG